MILSGLVELNLILGFMYMKKKNTRFQVAYELYTSVFKSKGELFGLILIKNWTSVGLERLWLIEAIYSLENVILDNVAMYDVTKRLENTN